MDDDSSDKGIAGRRAGIDRIDGELVKLLSERARLAQEIGKLKGDGPVLRPEREAEVLRRATSANPGPLPNESLGRVFAEEEVPAGRMIKAAEQIEERAFARARGPHDRDVIALRHIKIDAL